MLWKHPIVEMGAHTPLHSHSPSETGLSETSLVEFPGRRRLASYSSFWDLTRHAPPLLSQLKHTHAHTQTECLQAWVYGCCLNQTLISFNWWETNYNSFLRSAFILRPQRRAKHNNDRTKWSGRKWDDCYSFTMVPSICHLLKKEI